MNNEKSHENIILYLCCKNLDTIIIKMDQGLFNCRVSIFDDQYTYFNIQFKECTLYLNKGNMVKTLEDL